jgi:hyperosmotically inducible protein
MLAFARTKQRNACNGHRPVSITGADGTVAATIPRKSSALSTAIDGRQQDRHFHQQPDGETMKVIQFLKAAGSIACVGFALNAPAQTSASASSASPETTGQHIGDSTITTKAKADLLAASNVKSTHIHVKTHKGVVWLTGSVPTADDKSAAEQVVQSVKGVTGVKNQLKIAAE